MRRKRRKTRFTASAAENTVRTVQRAIGFGASGDQGFEVPSNLRREPKIAAFSAVKTRKPSGIVHRRGP